MSYWTAKADLVFLKQFRDNVEAMWAKEDEYANWRPPRIQYLGPVPDVEDDPAYQGVRGRIASEMNRAEAIAQRLAIRHSLSAILRDGTVKPRRQTLRDALNRTVGAAEEEVRVERRHLRNPLWWLEVVLDFVLRLPLIIASKMGADTEKLQKEVWPKVITVALYGVLAWLGLK